MPEGQWLEWQVRLNYMESAKCLNEFGKFFVSEISLLLMLVWLIML